MRDISIVVAGDEGIAPGLFATIGSCAVSCDAARRMVVHFLNTGLQDSTLESLRKFATQFPNMDLKVHDVDLSPFQGATLMKGGYASYARILFRRYIKESRVLYFDTDFLVLKDVSHLFDMDMDGATVWATMTPTIPWLADDCPFCQAEEIKGVPYFNAGVLLIDAEKWDEQNCEARILEKLKTRIPLKFHDQTLLNYVLKDHWKRLPDEWGLMMIHNTDKPLDTNYHFGGSTKPWVRGATFAATGLWWCLYEKKIKPYYQIPGAALSRMLFAWREKAVYYFLPVFGCLLRRMPRFRSKVARLVERRKFYCLFRRAEREASCRWEVR